MKVFDELQARGMIAQATNEEKIKELLTPGEAMDLQPQILAEIKRGHKTTIKLKPPKEKNAAATP